MFGYSEDMGLYILGEKGNVFYILCNPCHYHGYSNYHLKPFDQIQCLSRDMVHLLLSYIFGRANIIRFTDFLLQLYTSQVPRGVVNQIKVIILNSMLLKIYQNHF